MNVLRQALEFQVLQQNKIMSLSLAACTFETESYYAPRQVPQNPLNLDSLQTMLRLLMSSKFILPIETPSTIPMTTGMETLKGAHDGKVLLEMAGQVAVALEGLGAVFVGADETLQTGHVLLLVINKKIKNYRAPATGMSDATSA
jgi:hypothetical protein